jgi:tetratricopeptide (TPR) repeat protein
LAFDRWAPQIEALRHLPYFKAPFYPLFMAAVYRTLGHDPFRLLLVQVVVGSGSVLLMFALVRRLFGERAAWIAALLQIGYWPFTLFECERLIPVVLIFLDLSMTILLVEAGRRRKPWLWASAGAVTGLSAIARPNILAVVPFVVWWIHERVDGRRVSRWAVPVFFAGLAAVVLPVTVRNAVVGKDFVLIASQGGVNFYIGNNPSSNGIAAVVPGTRPDWWGGYRDSHCVAERALGRKLRESEISGYWYRRGLEFILHHPLRAAKLYFRKALLLLCDVEVSNNFQIYFRRRRSEVLRLLPGNWAILLAFALLGLLEIRKERPDRGDRLHRRVRSKGCSKRLHDRVRHERLLPYGLALFYAGSIWIFFVTSRFRLPVALFLVPGAAFGCLRLTDAVANATRGTGRWSALRKSAAVLAVLVLSSLDPYDVKSVSESRGYYELGVAYHPIDLDRAYEAATRSIEADSTYAAAWLLRGCIAADRGELVSAAADFRRACRIDPTFEDAHYALGVVYDAMGRRKAAMRAYGRAIALRPDHARALVNLANDLMREGRFETAVRYLLRALRAAPEYPNAHFGMGLYMEWKGDLERALEHYARARGMPMARRRMAVVRAALARRVSTIDRSSAPSR